MSRPEHIAPPEVFYNAIEASKYGGNSRMIEIQTRMTERALQLMKIDGQTGLNILDIGCGSGISGEVLSERGHYWVGLDISPHMLLVAKERETEGDLMLNDAGQGFKFRPGSFDGAISISAIQWLCNRDKTEHKPFNRLRAFFQSLFNCLVQGSRAVLQFYPENADQLEMITAAAMRSGFNGGVVVDFPHSAKAKKYFLVLTAGMTTITKNNDLLSQGLVAGQSTKTDYDRENEQDDMDDDMDNDGDIRRDEEGNLLGDDDDDDDMSEGGMSVEGGKTVGGKSVGGQTIRNDSGTIDVTQRKKQRLRKGQKDKSGKTKSWILKKKTQMRDKGRTVAKDSKFTGRKRKPRF